MQNSFSLVDASPFLLVLLGAVFVHACFQLSVSVLTLLSSHTIGRRLPNARLLNLNLSFILGVIVMTGLVLLAMLVFENLLVTRNSIVATILPLSILPVVALLIVMFYYRRGQGTQLWLPRAAAEYITGRAKKTRSDFEAFSLGIITALAELPFTIAPLAIVAFTLQGFSSEYWLQLSLIYAFTVCIPLSFVAFYISSGHKISSIQRWREGAKNYLKWTSATALLLLTAYIAVLQIGTQS